MEAVVAANDLMERKPEPLQDSCSEKKKKPVKPTSLSSGSDIEVEEESSVKSLKRVSNKKRKRSIADEGRVAKTKSSREKRAAKKRKEQRNGDDEKKPEEKPKKRRSSVKRRAKTKKEDEEREQELKLVPFIKPTDAVNGSCSHSESDSHVGILYTQRDPSFFRPISQGIKRCSSKKKCVICITGSSKNK